MQRLPSLAREIKVGTLVAIRIEGQDPSDRLTRPLAIIHRRHATLDPAASKFLELLTDQDVTIDALTPAEPSRRMPASTAP